LVRRSLLRRPLVCAALIAAALGLVSGCVTGPTELDSQAAARLQTLVADVATRAAANDYAGAVKTLDDLQTRLDSAAARGDVSYARHLQIQKSIEQVRADLLAKIPAQSATPSPAPDPAPSPSPDKVATPTPDPAPTTSSGNQQGPDKSKKPEDPGKGNGGGK
jgi:hypothetical protein